MNIKTESKFTFTEAMATIIGNSIGIGIIAVPYLAMKNTWIDVLWITIVAYIINVVLHLLIAELSLNSGGVQLVKCFEMQLLSGKSKKIVSWIFFIVYGFAIMIGVSGNINGGALILENWFGLSHSVSQILYYSFAAIIVFFGMKAVGIAQKYAIALLLCIVIAVSIGTFSKPLNTLSFSSPHINNILALYSMIVFSLSANQAVIQAVKGLEGDIKKIRLCLLASFAVSAIILLLITFTVMLGTKGTIVKELGYVQLGQSIGGWAIILAGIFSLLALLTTFWTYTLALRDVVYEQTHLNYKLCWVLATVPSLLFALFAVNSFIILTRIMSGIVVLVGITVIFAYNKSRKELGESQLCGIFGSLPFQIILVTSTIICAVGSLIPLK